MLGCSHTFSMSAIQNWAPSLHLGYGGTVDKTSEARYERQKKRFPARAAHKTAPPAVDVAAPQGVINVVREYLHLEMCEKSIVLFSGHQRFHPLTRRQVSIKVGARFEALLFNLVFTVVNGSIVIMSQLLKQP